uniref:glutathione transferase n=1 Tax=Anopheles farauti TaxID=69004 RepID=A0A182Q2T3_9DIPT
MSTPEMTLYYDEVSPPARSILMALSALGVKDRAKLVHIDLFNAEHFSQDFLKVNPLHTVPVLQHGDLTLTDSHAILMYLCDTFATAGHDLAIPDTLTRAKRKVFSGEITEPSEHLYPIEETIDALELYLKESKYSALDRLSVADFSIMATLASVNIVLPITADRWPRVAEWFDEIQALPWYDEQQRAGVEKIGEMFREQLNNV